MIKKTFVFGVLSCITFFSLAQQKVDSTKVEQLDEVVVTNSKFKLERENSGKVITKINQKELVQFQGKSVAEIINSTSGIEINGVRSNAGQNLSYFVRGGRNRQVLILIDGIAVTDASQLANDYDLRLLNSDQVESIEILKGASSTLYGSGAATAVINIKLKEASKKKISGTFRSVIGSNQSQNDNNYAIQDFRNSVSVNGTLNKFNYLTSFGNQYTDGLSAIADGTEADAFNSINGIVKMGYQFSDAFKLKIYGSFDTYKADFDDSLLFTDADNLAITNQYRVGLSPSYTYKNGSIILKASYNNTEREIASSFPTQFYAKSFVIDMYNKYSFHDKFYTVLGLNIQDSNMESSIIPFGDAGFEQSINPDKASFSILDPYANVVYESDIGLSVNMGARLNNHSEYGSHFVYSFNPSYKIKLASTYIKGMASYSTAYITPSLYQLFEPTYGNPDLKPEKNSTVELGAEIGIGPKGTISLVYFNRRETNFIDFIDLGGFIFQYNNIDEEFTASGIEFTSNYKFSSKINLSANVTYTKVKEDLNLRIPEIKINAKLDYQFCPKTNVSLTYQFTDDRKDAFYNNSTFLTEEVTLKSYSIMDFYISRKIAKDKLILFVNATNMLNEDFQELFGYTTRGRNINLGFNLSL